jgi:proteasome lid subunit RPN8/RPN11
MDDFRLTIEDQSWSSILQHTITNYPEEACGILLCSDEKPRHITEAHPTKNATLEDPARRYFVDPIEYLEVDKLAEQKGLDICGFYHSHPDHPSVPSEHDRKLAWEGYLYLIVSIKGGEFDHARTWIYNPDEKHFKEVKFKYKNNADRLF